LDKVQQNQHAPEARATKMFELVIVKISIKEDEQIKRHLNPPRNIFLSAFFYDSFLHWLKKNCTSFALNLPIKVLSLFQSMQQC
jgi:hypothetical protein